MLQLVSSVGHNIVWLGDKDSVALQDRMDKRRGHTRNKGTETLTFG
jgi:hypothetical protein